MNCKICQNTATLIFKTIILSKYSVQYYQCELCKFIQTEEPYWLAESYTEAIGILDVGLASRNVELADILGPIISKHFDKKGMFLDYGGGYGLFVRLMRDRGLNFYRQDSHCENLFAKYFDLKDLPENSTFDLVTAFEVFEHLANPLDEIEKMFEHAPSILFTTELQPQESFNAAEDWWYFSTEAGQHVSLYTYESLQNIARKFGKKLYSNKSNIHLLTDKSLSDSDLKMAIDQKVFNKLYRNREGSLLQTDYEKIKMMIKNKG